MGGGVVTQNRLPWGRSDLVDPAGRPKMWELLNIVGFCWAKKQRNAEFTTFSSVRAPEIWQKKLSFPGLGPGPVSSVSLRDRKGTPKNFCDKDFAELSGELSGAICLKTPVLLGSALGWFKKVFGAVRAIFRLWGSFLAPVSLWPKLLQEAPSTGSRRLMLYTLVADRPGRWRSPLQGLWQRSRRSAMSRSNPTARKFGGSPRGV